MERNGTTEFAASELINRIIVDMDKMNTHINIFLDLCKAFDTRNNKILLEKLKYYSINGIAYNLSVTTGISQGSILEPLLFIIYINDIANANNLFNFIIYADDTTLSTTLDIVIKDTNNGNIEAKLNKELAGINDN